MKLRRSQTGNERGQAVVMFALMIPVFLALGGFVIGIGNWYVHGKHLQTKADAGAFAGGGDWAFPCGPQIDARIDATARLYAGSNNPQVGGVPNASIRSVLNGPNWYDDDGNPLPSEFYSPPTFSSPPVVPVCNAMILDVKVTEDNSFPLFSLIPLFPDIKRRARVEIQEAEGVTGLIPIAVRAPEPVSAAVFYDEVTGDILRVRYFVKRSIFGLPGSLQGWSTENSEDGSLPAQFTPTAKTGVAIAISLRGACNTGLPTPNTKIVTTPAPCFEDAGFATVDQLCNQGGAAQIVECYFASGGSVQRGLHFIRGYPTGDVAQGQPALRSAWLENIDCPSNGYFSSVPGTNPCRVRLKVRIDVGSKIENPLPNPPNTNVETRVASNVEVRYCLVLPGDTGALFCNSQFNSAAFNDLPQKSGGPGEVEASTDAGTDLRIPRNSQGAAVAIRVRLKDTSIAGEPGCNLVANDTFNSSCQFYFTGAGGPPSATGIPSATRVFAEPVQRSFRGNTVNSSSVRWLRLTADRNCSATLFIDNEAASQPTSGDSCFFMEMGLKGGLALDSDEPAFVFNDGTGASQTGVVDCDPNIPQGQVATDGVIQGCGPWYARHPFDWTPPCPPSNSIFAGYPAGNPGPPWDDGRWPPLRCIKTRPSSNPNQFESGFDNRLFGSNNAPCPPDAAPSAGNPTGYVKGRNYWDQDNNPLNNRLYGYKDDSPARDTFFNPNDPRIVTIFLTTSDAFTGPGQDTYEITGLVEVYVTGYGRINGGGNLTVDDPCPGSTPPPQEDYDCSGVDCGYIVWGHFMNYVVPGAQGTPSGVICNPGTSSQVCVAVLVE